MYKNICEIVVKNKHALVPTVFTDKQVALVKKYIHKGSMTNTEKTYFYAAIKKKLDALATIHEEWHINGRQMILERIVKAKQILGKLNNKKAFISGSFLYAKHYNDIDIFIVGNSRKQYREGKKNFIYITESDLQLPLFYSCVQYCVANHTIKKIKPILKRPAFDEILLTYQLTLKEILDKEDEKTLRSLIFLYHLSVKDDILDSYTLHLQFESLRKKNTKAKIGEINYMVKEMFLQLFSGRYTEEVLRPLVKHISEDVQQYKHNEALLISQHLLEEVKNECKRAQTATS